MRRWVLKPLKLYSARWRPFRPSNEKWLSRERSWNIILAGGILEVWFRGELSTQDILSSLLQILEASAVQILMETYVFRVPSRAMAELVNDCVSIFHHQVKSSIWMGRKAARTVLIGSFWAFPKLLGWKDLYSGFSEWGNIPLDPLCSRKMDYSPSSPNITISSKCYLWHDGLIGSL